MNKFSKIVTATALVIVSFGASAWWGPMSSLSDDFFGNGFADAGGDFNMAMHANSQAFGRGYGYNRYYHAPHYFGYPAAPLASAGSAAETAQVK